MKLIIVLFAIVCCIYNSIYIKKVNEIDSLVYELYENNFNEYLIVDKEGNLEYDTRKLKVYFESKGFEFECIKNKLSFNIYFEIFDSYKREYNFLLEINNEF